MTKGSVFLKEQILTLPSKNPNATLLGIVTRWSPPALITDSTKRNRSIIYGLMPDLIDKTKVEPSCYIDMTERYDGHFVDGCWRTDSQKITYYNKDEVLRLLYAITDNTPISYKGGQHTVNCRENMLNKIYYLVLQSDVRNITPLFTDLQLHPFPEHQEVYKEDFIKAIQQLYQLGTKESFTYGIFLLILHAVFHRDMAPIHFLYSGEALSKVINATAPRKIDSNMMPENHVYFGDKLYSHDYSAYMFRDNYDRLYEKGHFELKCDGGIPSALLFLEDLHSVDPITNNSDPVSHRYAGTPILSVRDNLIYILMHDENDLNATGILVLQYSSFSNGKHCYYRSGLFVSSYHKKYPEVRKIVLTERKLSDDELPTVKGILKMTSRQVIMSERQMAAFCKEYEGQHEWLAEFKKSIPVYHKNWYCFDDRFVMTNADSELDELERLKLSLVLRSYCKGASEAFNRIHCNENPNIFKFMR